MTKIPVRFPSYNQRPRSACGVGLIVNIPGNSDHQIVKSGLAALERFRYRSGFNPVTRESDGAGLRLFGLPSNFYNNLIRQGEFVAPKGTPLKHIHLRPKQFIVGQYFLPPDKILPAQALIERSVAASGLFVLGWRNLDNAVNLDVLSRKAREKKPGIWQAILMSPAQLGLDEHSAWKAAFVIHHEAKKHSLPIHIVSQSAESIVYKGMIQPEYVGDFYQDLANATFHASAVAVHARFATNTDPKWANAQPCSFAIMHNGEFNSVRTNAADMISELAANDFRGIYPDQTLSDSMQMDADLANQMIMKNISFPEAMLRLMPPKKTQETSQQEQAMLDYFAQERTPYNGPAFLVGGAGGYYIAALDQMGLRPSRWALIATKEGQRQFHAGSDDYLRHEDVTILQKGHLDPGGCFMVNPRGELLRTAEILQEVHHGYAQNNPHWFQDKLEEMRAPLEMIETGAATQPLRPLSVLNQQLFYTGWDFEAAEESLRYMATHGSEPLGAMGDDTNPLYTSGMPMHLSYLFHHLFAQVSAPPLDSLKERDRFSLRTTLGPAVGAVERPRILELTSPILAPDALNALLTNHWVSTKRLALVFPIPNDCSLKEFTNLLTQAIKQLIHDAERLVTQQACGVIILTDSGAGQDSAYIPDVIAVAAVRKHLEQSRLIRRVSLVVDSSQISGPHQASLLLALGAKAVHPSGAYEKIAHMFPAAADKHKLNYQTALIKCLLKSMGKVGITDVNNYINGHFIAAMGLDLTLDADANPKEPSLASIFQGIYSPLKGYNFGHVAASLYARHEQAYKLHRDFNVLPRSGFYMPEKQGIKHGYGPEVVNAFTEWLKSEDLRAKLWQLHTILERKGYPGFATDLSLFSATQGFLDPRKKDAGPLAGVYPPAYLETMRPGQAFRKMMAAIDRYCQEHPTALRDYFRIKHTAQLWLARVDIKESQASIRARLFSGSMSQGALTVTDPDNPSLLGAHETLTQGMNAIGAMSASGEGGEAWDDLRSPSLSTRSKQVASGRFGVSARQMVEAWEIEIKIAQGAKPGEGGELPAKKVSVRFAAQRGGIPGINFISPPPHHDIYSIEDLEQLIYDIKSVSPQVKVAVKLVASEGIDTIAVGVAKAGADVINIASHSGGTAAAQQSSIKHTGFPAELALVQIHQALQQTGLRDLVQLRLSGGFKTANHIIVAAILGADLFEFGTTAMLTLGCKMQRTCNHSCQPGVATDGHLFKGDQLNTERYFVNLAAMIQEMLEDLGVANLSHLRGHVDLLERSGAALDACFDLSPLLKNNQKNLSVNDDYFIEAYTHRTVTQLVREKEDSLIQPIQTRLAANPLAEVVLSPIKLQSTDRSFGARLAGHFVKHLETYPGANIVLHTSGVAGQSFAFVLPAGFSIYHEGSVLDGCAKSMTGGKLVLKTPNESQAYRGDCNTIAGNAMAYGASGGKIFVNGVAGHRFGVLLKGAEVVVEGVGDFAFEYMTSGTGLVLGKTGPGVCNSAMGGIVWVYDPDNSSDYVEEAVRVASAHQKKGYEQAILSLLQAHAAETGSLKAKEILANFNIDDFKVLIPKQLDRIQTPRALIDVLKTYQLSKAPFTSGMEVWLRQRINTILTTETLAKMQIEERLELRAILQYQPIASLFPKLLIANLSSQHKKSVVIKAPSTLFKPVAPKYETQVAERLSTISGQLDEEFADALTHIGRYVAALSQDAQGCSGCRAQSCAGGDGVDTGCPSGKSINTINALLKRLQPLDLHQDLSVEQWRTLRQAFEVQIESSPFIAYTGAACPAPCQDACTESIPNPGDSNPHRGGKAVGEPVHIKNIEFYLFQIGRRFGWFDGNTPAASHNFVHYDAAMQGFKPAFRQIRQPRQGDKGLIIIGSGPAAMQLAFEALREGIKVSMYEKSPTPGGLLATGIPPHKFSKEYIKEDFLRLQAMGLDLHLNSEVVFDPQTRVYKLNNASTDRVIADLNHAQQMVALCVGSGSPKKLPGAVTLGLDVKHHASIIQAVDFLRAANDVARQLVANPNMPADQRNQLIAHHFQHFDPRGKKIVVVGGGDTAQDVIRWIARYFEDQSKQRAANNLNILVRGVQSQRRGVLDGYPALSKAPTKEHKLQDEEVSYVNGNRAHLVEVSRISAEPDGRLKLDIVESEFKYHDIIQRDKTLQQLSESLPREMRPLDKSKNKHYCIEHVDLVICAMGFADAADIPIVRESLVSGAENVMIAGDASGVESSIIVGAQANARNTWQQRRASILGTNPTQQIGQVYSLFATKETRALEADAYHTTVKKAL